MKTLSGFVALFVLLAGTSGGASAAVVSFSGEIEILLGGGVFPIGKHLPPLVVPGSGLATVNGSGGASGAVTSLSLPAGAFSTTLAVPVANAFPIVALFVSASNGSAVFSSGQAPCGTPHPQVTCSNTAALHGRSGLAGSLVLGLFNTASGPFSNLTVPLGLVGGGSTFATGPDAFGVTAMVQGAGWTTGTVSVSPAGTTAGIVVAGGQSAAGTQQVITLVSPLAVYTNAFGPFLPASFVSWQVRLSGWNTPEPGTLLLLGTGILGLAATARTRRR